MEVLDCFQFSSVQSLSRVQLFVTPWIAARQASLSITNSQSSLKLMSIGLLYYRSNTNYWMSSFKHLLIFLVSHLHITTSVQFISFPDFSLCWPISILILSNYFLLRSQRDSNNMQNRACRFPCLKFFNICSFLLGKKTKFPHRKNKNVQNHIPSKLSTTFTFCVVLFFIAPSLR